MEMGACYYHQKNVLLSGDSAIRAAVTEGCLGDRAPGSQVVAHEGDAAPLHSRALLLPPKEGSHS